MVMATGIVSIAAQLLGMTAVARLLFALNLVFYPALVALTIVRIARYRDRVVADLLDHGRSVGFFTTVAGTCVLGSQFVIVAGMWPPAAVLWAVGILLWAVITYGVLAVLTVKEHKPPMPEGLSGGWLVSVVAAQSVSVLGTQLAAGFGAREPLVLFFSLLLWLGGGMLYIWIISLIFFRYTFFVMEPSDLGPPYWINMGAVAISTLAGALLVAAAPASPVLDELMPFLKGHDAAVLGDRHLVDPDARASWASGAISSAAFRFVTTPSTGVPCSRSGCTPSAPIGSGRSSKCPC